VVGRFVTLLVVLAVGLGGTWVLTTAAAPPPGPTTDAIPAWGIAPADVEVGSEAPVDDPDTGPGRPGDTDEARTLDQWADELAPVVGIPARALRAYGNAELVLREELPDCRLSWTMLAGLGRVESNHGRHGGAVIDEDGRPSPPIIGVALDGSPGVKAIADTDGGRLDGDTRYDRAVGPMQFIPSTWALVGVDASGDGKADPHQIDDAALTAGFYLCAHGRDVATGEGWWDAVLSYNRSVEYARTVFALAAHYAELVRNSAERD
jgi:membrane-bound lytic murein transglycosylase B